jgi:membrane protease YdiL (CAAX protease family)
MSQTVSTSPTDQPGRLPSRVRAVLVATGLVVAAVLLSLVVGVAVALPLLFGGFDPTSAVVLVASLLATQLSFAVVATLYLWRCDWGVAWSVPTGRDLLWVVGGVVLTLAAAVGLLGLSELIGVEPVESVIEAPVLADPTLLLVLAGLSIVLVAPVEELLFRGVVQGRLRQTFGAPVAVGIASLLFASIHLLNLVTVGVGAVVMVAVIFVVGAVLGVAYERTDNLLVPVLVHGVYNTTLFVLTYVSLSSV